MSDTVQTPAADTTRLAALAGYALFILALLNGITAIVGVVIAYIKRTESRGTIWESHFNNMIRLFWVTLVIIVAMMMVALFGLVSILAAFDSPSRDLVYLMPVLFALGIGALVWYLYCTVRGFIRALDNQPY